MLWPAFSEIQFVLIWLIHSSWDQIRSPLGVRKGGEKTGHRLFNFYHILFGFQWWLDILCGWRICIDFDSWFPFQFQTAALYERRRSIPLWREIFKNHEVTFRSAFREFNQWPPRGEAKHEIKLLLLNDSHKFKSCCPIFPSLMSSQSDGREKLRMLCCKPLMFSILAL